MSLNNETISAKVNERFGNDILQTEMPYNFLTITVKKEKLEEVIKFLKEDTELNFHFLTTACGVHFPDTAEPFGMMYQLHNMPANVRIRVKVRTADPSPVFPSMTKFWPAANWMERESYDFFGYRFAGHPDLRRILNMDSLEGWPLRKEFPLEDPLRLDKDDKMFGR